MCPDCVPDCVMGTHPILGCVPICPRLCPDKAEGQPGSEVTVTLFQTAGRGKIAQRRFLGIEPSGHPPERDRDF